MSGKIDWTITALNATTPVAINLPSNAGGSVSLYVSDNSLCYVSKDAAKTSEREFPVERNESWIDISPSYGSSTLFYMRSAVGTPNAILLFKSK